MRTEEQKVIDAAQNRLRIKRIKERVKRMQKFASDREDKLAQK